MRQQDSEIFIAGFMNFSDTDDMNLICLSILRGIIPLLNAEEICSTRLVHARDPNNQTKSAYPSIIVRLSTTSRTKQILTEKKERNYYSTNDIVISILHEELLSRLPITKIIINDALSSSEYKQYLSLKSIAKKLGFAYVWHSGGKFLVRWKNKQRAFSFNNVTDLNAIRNIYINSNSTELQQQQIQGITDSTDSNKNINILGNQLQ